MNSEKKYTAVQNAPYLLSQQELDNPWLVIDDFLQNRHLAEHRQVLWDILCAAMTSDLAGINDPREIASWVMYFRSLEETIEALSIIHIKQKPLATLKPIR